MKKWLSYIQTHQVVILLLLVLALSAFLRLYQLDSNVPGLSQDEVVNGYDAYSLSETLRDHHGNFLPLTLASFGDSASVLLTYLTVPFIAVGGLTDFAVRLPIALTGIATTLFAFLFVRALTKNHHAALLAAFVFAVIPWNITLTRWAIPPSIVPSLIMLLLWLFTVGVKERKTRYLIGAGIAASLLTYSYPAAIFFAPLFVGSLLILFLWKRWKDFFKVAIPYALLSAPLYLLILINPTANFRRFGAVSLTSSGGNIFYEVGSRYFEYFSPQFLFGSIGKNLMMQVPGTGNFYVLFFVILIIAAIFFVLKLRTKSYRTLLKKNVFRYKAIILMTVAWLAISPVPAAITVDHQHLTRAITLLPVVTLLLVGVTYWLLRSTRQSVKPIVVSSFIVLILVSLCSYMFTYTTSYRAQAAATEFHYGVRESIQYLSLIDDPAQISRVSLDESVNQIYIYYLFYAAYPPKEIDYNFVNFSIIANVPYQVDKMNRYTFDKITDEDAANAELIKRIEGFGKIWYEIYRLDDVLYLKSV